MSTIQGTRGNILCLIFLVFIIGFSLISCQDADTSKANEDAYTYIKNCEELQGIRNSLSGNFELVKDIDCDDSKNWNSAAGFIPIGDDINPFTGTLLGNGHKISNLYINRPDTDLVGLFGGNRGTIKSLGLVNANIKGKSETGILVGRNIRNENNYLEIGVVQKVYASGSVSGKTFHIGGVLGSNYGTLSFAYSTATVSGENYIGGLVGSNYFEINESYVAGAVSGTSSAKGGLVGDNLGVLATVSKSYYDYNVSKQAGAGTAKSTIEMKQVATFVDWDTSVWNLVNGAYPTLKF